MCHIIHWEIMFYSWKAAFTVTVCRGVNCFLPFPLPCLIPEPDYCLSLEAREGATQSKHINPPVNISFHPHSNFQISSVLLLYKMREAGRARFTLSRFRGWMDVSCLKLTQINLTFFIVGLSVIGEISLSIFAYICHLINWYDWYGTKVCVSHQTNESTEIN